MSRIRLIIQYDGSEYAGWQRQANHMTVQQRIEEALAKLTGKHTGITGASRTDAGVHARGQVAHFDTDASIPPQRYWLALNTHLPPDIRIVDSYAVDPDFHARFHARRKQYTYRIYNAPCAPAIGRQYMWHVIPPLDAEKMHLAAQQIVGAHDFTACMASGGESKDFVRTMDLASVTQEGNVLTFTIQGNGFLYNMVRILAGTLCYIGYDKLPPECITRALESGNRLDLGITAPPQGLTLEWVEY